MTSRIALLFALLLPSTALADSWDVAPTRFRLQPETLVDEGGERGLMRTPMLIVLGALHAPSNDTEGETWNWGGGLRVELDFPLFPGLTFGAFVDGSWQGYFSQDEYEYVHFGVLEYGLHARLRASLGLVGLYLGAHGGVTHTFGHHQLNTWHAGGHIGMWAGKAVAMHMQLALTARDWNQGVLEYDNTFNHLFVDMVATIGLSVALGDYR